MEKVDLELKSLKIEDDITEEDNFITVECSLESELGTGGKLWDAAIIHGKYLQKQLEQGAFKRGKALEIGAGTGMLSILLGCLGCTVLASDTRAVQEGILEKNVGRNRSRITKGRGEVKAIVLDWNDLTRLEKTFEEHSLAEVGLIVGSDLIFNSNNLTEIPRVDCSHLVPEDSQRALRQARQRDAYV